MRGVTGSIKGIQLWRGLETMQNFSDKMRGPCASLLKMMGQECKVQDLARFDAQKTHTGAAMKALSKSTKRRKGHIRRGVDTGKLRAGLASGALRLRTEGPELSAMVVPLQKGHESWPALQVFLFGRHKHKVRVRKSTRKSGETRGRKAGPPKAAGPQMQEPRDYIGIASALWKKYNARYLDLATKTMGFR